MIVESELLLPFMERVMPLKEKMQRLALVSDGYYLSCISLQDKMPQLSRVTTTTQSNSRHLQKQAQEEMQ